MAASNKGRRISILVEYDGERFHGWQKQKGVTTVQGELEQAVSRMLAGAAGSGEIRVQGASRTDRGVHADAQVAHFHDPKGISCEGWTRGLTSNTPGDISVLNAALAEPDFHSRFDALGKTYRYRVISRLVAPARDKCAWFLPYPLDVIKMRAAADALIGEHDFAPFTTGLSRLPDDFGTVRRVFSASIERKALVGGWQGELRKTAPLPAEVIIEITGDGFLYNMVRNIAGALVEVGRGKRDVEWIYDCLQSSSRPLELPTAPARGLVLRWVYYAVHPHADFRPPDIPDIPAINPKKS